MTCTGMAFFPTNFMLQTSHDQEDDHHAPISSPLITPLNLPPCSSTQDFHGVGSFLGKRSMSFSGIMNANVVTDINNCEDQTTNLMNGDPDHDELSDDGSQAGEKKRRLNMEQVKMLERNFELGNKLEPERKMQLARALGLQPRQIAIWFQNRRARWKTKQLEKDYDLLKRQFEAIKAENDSLRSQNQKLHSEILALKNREPTESINLNKETEGSSSNRSENSSEIKLDILRTQAAIDSPIMSNNNNHHHHHDHRNHQTIPNSRNLFPTSNNNSNININTGIRPNATSAVAQQLFHSSLTRPDHHHQTGAATTTVKEESFCNMFCGIEDQPGFWPWLEQQHFN